MAGGRPWTDQEEWFVAQCVVKDMRIREIVDAIPEHFPARSYDSIHSAHSRRPGIVHEVARLRAGGEPRNDFRVPEPEAPEPLPVVNPTDEKIMGLERKVVARDDEIRQLRQKLKASHRGETLGEWMEGVIREAVQPIEPIRTIRKIKESDRQATLVHAVSALGDEHADKKVSTAASWGLEEFDFGTFRCRLWRWANKEVQYLTELLPRHRFTHHWVFKLGDANEGLIHGAGPRNEFGTAPRAALMTGDVEAQALEWIYRQTGIPMTVVSLGGNHTRLTAKKDYPDPTGNWDWVIAATIATRLRNIEGIRVIAPRAWTAFVDVLGHPCALNHGDDLRGTWGIPWYGVDKKANRVQALTARKRVQIRYFYYGHFHQEAKIPSSGGLSFFNGAFTLTSEFALERMAAAAEPMQLLHVFSEKRGRILEVPIELIDHEAEAAFRAGTWEPELGKDSILEYLEPERGPVGELAVIQAEAA